MPRALLEISQSMSSVALKISLVSGNWVMLLPNFRTATFFLFLIVKNAASLTGAMNLMLSIQHVLITRPTNIPINAREKRCLNVVKMISALHLTHSETLKNGKVKTLIADLSLNGLRMKNTSSRQENARTIKPAFATMDAQTAATIPIQLVTNASGSHQMPCAVVFEV